MQFLKVKKTYCSVFVGNIKQVIFPIFLFCLNLWIAVFIFELISIPYVKLFHGLSLQFTMSPYALCIFIIHAILLVHIFMSNYKFADFFLLFPSLCAFNSLKNKKNVTLLLKVNINVIFNHSYCYFYSM